jgi:hypothetical protein
MDVSAAYDHTRLDDAAVAAVITSRVHDEVFDDVRGAARRDPPALSVLRRCRAPLLAWRARLGSPGSQQPNQA